MYLMFFLVGYNFQYNFFFGAPPPPPSYMPKYFLLGYGQISRIILKMSKTAEFCGTRTCHKLHSPHQFSSFPIYKKLTYHHNTRWHHMVNGQLRAETTSSNSMSFSCARDLCPILHAFPLQWGPCTNHRPADG